MSDPREKAPAEMSDRELDAAVAQEVARVCVGCGGSGPFSYRRDGSVLRMRRKCVDCERAVARQAKMRIPQVARKRKWVPRDQTKFWARYKVRDLMREYPGSRGHTCSACGRVGRIYAHHDDYYRPYDVRLLCSACHGLTHRLPPARALVAASKQLEAKP